MSIATPNIGLPDDANRSVLLRHVSWEAYQTLLHEIGDDAVRLTYDDGYLEIEVPGKRHEELKNLAKAIVEAVLDAKRIDYSPLGSTTWNRSERLKGIEADECYYIGPVANLTVGKDRVDTQVDPAPNLAIEVDVTASSIDKLRVYAGIGVKEVWRIDESANVTFLSLDAAGQYQPIPVSRELPELLPDVLTEHLRLLNTTTHARALWQFKDRLPALLRSSGRGDGG